MEGGRTAAATGVSWGKASGDISVTHMKPTFPIMYSYVVDSLFPGSSAPALKWSDSVPDINCLLQVFTHRPNTCTSLWPSLVRKEGICAFMVRTVTQYGVGTNRRDWWSKQDGTELQLCFFAAIWRWQSQNTVSCGPMIEKRSSMIAVPRQSSTIILQQRPSWDEVNHRVMSSPPLGEA